jgi:branched-chain amino acid transport system substrate-binding protein
MPIQTIPLSSADPTRWNWKSGLGGLVLCASARLLSFAQANEQISGNVMPLTRRLLLGATSAVAVTPVRHVRGQSATRETVRIGMLTDMSGPYRDVTGPTGVACARQAIAEFTAAHPGTKVELLVADHQNKPDVAVGTVREWFDRGGVDAIVGVDSSAVALACTTVCAEKDKVHLNTGAGTSVLTGKSCNANTVHWTLDTWNLPHSTATAVVKSGGDSWFFITADYTFGHVFQRDTTEFIQAAGGRVVGSAQFPFPETTDFSAYLLQAQASGAKVAGFAASGANFVNLVKQAREFGLDRTMTLAAIACFITDVQAMGLPVAQGLILTENFYWDLNDRSRAFMQRVKPTLPSGVFPNMDQAGSYAATRHYLRTVQAMGAARAKVSGRDTVAAMKRMPTDDDCFGPGSIREDGRKIHPAYLFRVKKPEESRYPGDVFTLLATTPADEAFRPMSEGGCPLVHA